MRMLVDDVTAADPSLTQLTQLTNFDAETAGYANIDLGIAPGP